MGKPTKTTKNRRKPKVKPRKRSWKKVKRKRARKPKRKRHPRVQTHPQIHLTLILTARAIHLIAPVLRRHPTLVRTTKQRRTSWRRSWPNSKGPSRKRSGVGKRPRQTRNRRLLSKASQTRK